FAPALNARAEARLRLENELRSALVRGELVLHWQPVVRGWPPDKRANPTHGLLGPEHFVPLAEDCGMIRAIGEWTLEHALSQAGAWQRTLGKKLWFSVNVSAPELQQGRTYIEKLRAILHENQL